MLLDMTFGAKLSKTLSSQQEVKLSIKELEFLILVISLKTGLVQLCGISKSTSDQLFLFSI